MTEKLIHWYSQNKRDLPWRKTKDPYKIWVSEIILQQTQIKTGLVYYHNFIKKYPDIFSLARTTEVELLKAWQGLGYYNRAMNMLSSAKHIVACNKGKFPISYGKLVLLKGVGSYTAAAISSICNDEKKAVLDGNVFRVISRFFNINTPINTSKGKAEFQLIANKLLPKNNFGIYNQAIMDFGAIHCKKHNPKCSICPIKTNCLSFKHKNIDSRPVKNRQKKVKTRHFNYLVIFHKSYIYMQKRTSEDIWRRLFELPLIESTRRLNSSKIQQHEYLKKSCCLSAKLNYKVTHMLSHQKLLIYFWDVKVVFNKHNWSQIDITKINQIPLPRPLEIFFQSKYFST